MTRLMNFCGATQKCDHDHGLSDKAPFKHAVFPCNVPEQFLHGVMCECAKGFIFQEIYTVDLPVRDLVTFLHHCRYVNESSNIAGGGTKRVMSVLRKTL